MNAFLTELETRNLDSRSSAVLLKALYFQSDSLGLVIVESGFVTDFFSVPWGCWNIIPPRGRYDPVAVVHDWFYKTQIVTRKQADIAMLEGFQAMGCSIFRRCLIYETLRISGWAAWNNNKKHLWIPKRNSLSLF